MGKRSVEGEIEAMDKEDDDVETIASKINNAPDLLWGTDEKATKNLLEKAPEQLQEEPLSLSNILTAFGDVHWWGINLQQTNAVNAFTTNATSLFTLSIFIQIAISSITILSCYLFPDMLSTNLPTFISTSQLSILIIVSMIVGGLQTRLSGDKIAKSLHAANLLMLGLSIYCWSTNAIQSSLPAKLFFLISVLNIGWNDLNLW